jgi:hypothetical protein
MEKNKCYELKHIMGQNDEQFINIWNRFWIVTQLELDVDIINNEIFIHHQMIKKFHIYFAQMKQTFKKKRIGYLSKWRGCIHIVCIQ